MEKGNKIKDLMTKLTDNSGRVVKSRLNLVSKNDLLFCFTKEELFDLFIDKYLDDQDNWDIMIVRPKPKENKLSEVLNKMSSNLQAKNNKKKEEDKKLEIKKEPEIEEEREKDEEFIILTDDEEFDEEENETNENDIEDEKDEEVFNEEEFEKNFNEEIIDEEEIINEEEESDEEELFFEENNEEDAFEIDDESEKIRKMLRDYNTKILKKIPKKDKKYRELFEQRRPEPLFF